MKNRIYLILVLLLMCCTTSDNETIRNSISLSIIVDRTDDEITKPGIKDIEQIVRHFEDEHILVRYLNLGNANLNEAYILSLPTDNLFGNRLERKVRVERFYEKLDTLLIEQNAKSYHYNNSSIYLPLVEQLNKVSTSKQEKKIVILYSDVIEFSSTYNLYKRASLQKMHNKPEAVVEHFKSVRAIPDLTGVSLYIVNYPRSEKENQLFQTMCDFYKDHLFKDSGLTIHFGIDKDLNIQGHE